MKPRIIVPAPTSAGFESVQESAHRLRGLPFDPHDYPVESGALSEQLEAIATVDVLHRLQKYDRRTTAAAHYERRIRELRA